MKTTSGVKNLGVKARNNNTRNSDSNTIRLLFSKLCLSRPASIMQRWCVCGCIPDVAACISLFVLLLALHTTDSTDEESYKTPTPSRHKRAPGWGKRGSGSMDGEDLFDGDDDDSPQSLLKRAPGWGKRAPGWGKRSFSDVSPDGISLMDLEKRAPGWGKRAPGWGKRAPGWGKRSSSYISPDGYVLMERRGWGKRSQVVDADLDVKRTPGWGKRSTKRAPGWGKRSELNYCDSLSQKVDDYIERAIEVSVLVNGSCIIDPFLTDP